MYFLCPELLENGLAFREPDVARVCAHHNAIVAGIGPLPCPFRFKVVKKLHEARRRLR